MPRPRAVYRCFGEDGVLLYVGISVDPLVRMFNREHAAEWAREIRNIQVEWVADKFEAARLELEAIMLERPKYNVRCALQYKEAKTEVGKILKGLGHEVVAKALDVHIRRVDRAALDERLPAIWWAKLSDLAGRDLPYHLFTFKGLDVA